MSGFASYQQPGAGASDFNAMAFVVRQFLARVSTATLVRVVAVTNTGGVSPIGFVDVAPEVDQIDADGVRVAHATIFHCPYFRLQGGTDAIIIDPKVGDIGLIVFADRDVSSVVASQGQAGPGSARRFDMADGLYVGMMVGVAAPTQYVQFSAAGIKIHSPALVNLDAPDVQIHCATLEIQATTSATITTPNFRVNGATTLAGSLDTQGQATFESTVSANGHRIDDTHIHNGVTPGGGLSGPPI